MLSSTDCCCCEHLHHLHLHQLQHTSSSSTSPQTLAAKSHSRRRAARDVCVSRRRCGHALDSACTAPATCVQAWHWQTRREREPPRSAGKRPSLRSAPVAAPCTRATARDRQSESSTRSRSPCSRRSSRGALQTSPRRLHCRGADATTPTCDKAAEAEPALPSRRRRGPKRPMRARQRRSRRPARHAAPTRRQSSSCGAGMLLGTWATKLAFSRR